MMSYTILIVDDSAVTRSVLRKTIGMADVPVKEIVEAPDGREALERLKEQSFDLILTDLNMPIMNGREMASQVLANEKTCHIPILVISTESSQTRIDELVKYGIKGYIHKPFSPEKVRDELLRVLTSCSV